MCYKVVHHIIFGRLRTKKLQIILSIMVLLYFFGVLVIMALLLIWVGGSIRLHLAMFALNLVLDFYSFSFLLLLFLISTQVLLWSYYYIDIDSAYRRFLGLVFCFLRSIFILVFFCSLYGALIG